MKFLLCLIIACGFSSCTVEQKTAAKPFAAFGAHLATDAFNLWLDEQ